MRKNVPTYFGSHLAAIAGVTVLHTSIAAWAMMPTPPVAMPAQQIIQISMVAPTTIKQDVSQKPVVEMKKKLTKTPPKETGMVKVEEQQPITEKKEIEKKEVKEKIASTQAQTNLTSGLQASDALLQESAITEPVAASYLKNQPPRYPSSARKRKQQGTVMLEIQVSVEGSPKAVKVEKSSGFDTLDKAALSAVKKWKFVPARRGSSVVEASVIVPIVFKINS